jgi:hypothetical protein
MATKSLSSLKSFKDVGDPEAERATKLKKDWNLFQAWLGERGLKGHPSLDRGVGDANVGLQYVKQFQKENPTTLVTPQNIPEIQGHFKNYRDYTLNKLRNRQAMLIDAKNPNGRYVAPDENLDFYMSGLSKVDGIPGSLTTQHRFPDSFLTTIYRGTSGKIEKQMTVNQGLAQ